MPGCLNTVGNQLGTRRSEGRDQKTKKRVSIQFGVQKYRRQKIPGERKKNQYHTAGRIMLNYNVGLKRN